MSSHNPSRTLPFAVTIPISRSPDPDVIDIDDSREAVGEWPDHTEPCPALPARGQCQYSWRDDYTSCIHCKQESGL